MNCYLCLLETGSMHRSAHALCQQCGACVCIEHLIELTYPPMVGMGGNRGKRHSMICRRCYSAMLPASHTPQTRKAHRHMLKQHQRANTQETASRWNIRNWFKGRKQVELPASEEVVKAVELYLESLRQS